MKKIILASSSPRRKAALKTLGVPFRIVLPEFAEILPNGVSAENAAEFFAVQKAASVVQKLPQQNTESVLAADTAIVLDKKLYGKPSDAREAASFLSDFSANTHTVYSSIAFYDAARATTHTRTAKTEVAFKPLSREEIEWYVRTGEWRGAAGGYRIQEKGACFIAHIFGTPSCVEGLPLFELYDILLEHGYLGA